ncbi:DUF885 domain-containing protein [Ferrimonas pelagia]|uniref:DUF885 domain-containing protein n=1 Tax=Ferrimonas pelagia TaxID=1177826 RepID=A0ABP9ECN7_9GAMM
MKPYRSILALSLSLALGFTTNVTAAAPLAAEPAQEQQSSSAKANALFETIFMENVMASPESQSYLGIKQDQDKWNEIGEQADAQALARTQRHLQLLRQIDPDKLDPQTRLSYQLLEKKLQEAIDDHRWRHHTYPVNQMFGLQSGTPAFLINQHQISNVTDAEAYISRVRAVERRFDQLITLMSAQERRGIMPPKFVFAHTINDSQNIIQGAPFESGQDSALLADFKAKLASAQLEDKEQQRLLAELESALSQPFLRGYRKLIAYLQSAQQHADEHDGVWKLPDGEAYYAMKLKRTTTTELSAKQIHQLGLDEVARIHNEMRAIMRQVEFDGELQDFFAFMRTDPQFYFTNDEAGKQAYIQQANATIGAMKDRLDEVFRLQPKADLLVKPVEAFRERSAGKAFYQQPAPDGSRPGTYYANLYDMAQMPSYQLEALAFHEGIPGHHMQIAIAQELESLPKFRRFGRYTAYIEGWGLYSEYLPKELGFYQDPYSDFGRLAMELWRACRLVVDTGLHDRRWTRQQAIDYLASNTPNAQGDVVKAIERYIVMPGQATAYKIGMLKLLELRSIAQERMGEKFELKGFHDAVLANGPLPLDILEQQVAQWGSERIQL